MLNTQYMPVDIQLLLSLLNDILIKIYVTYAIFRSKTLSKVTVLQVFDHSNLIFEHEVLVQIEK